MSYFDSAVPSSISLRYEVKMVGCLLIVSVCESSLMDRTAAVRKKNTGQPQRGFGRGHFASSSGYRILCKVKVPGVMFCEETLRRRQEHAHFHAFANQPEKPGTHHSPASRDYFCSERGNTTFHGIREFLPRESFYPGGRVK